jgi:hypothetical protein
MTTLDFSDYYKFVVSLGVLLIALALLLPWLFLREAFDLQVTAEAIGRLPIESQAILADRRFLAHIAIQVIPWISTVLAGSGGVLAVAGLARWRRRQLVRDEEEGLQVEKLRAEIRQLTPAEVASKGVKEAEAELPQTASARDGAESSEPLPKFIGTVNRYLWAESLVLERLARYLPRSRRLLANVQVGDSEFDAIVQSKGRDSDVLVEVKYASARNVWNRLDGLLPKLSGRRAVYERLTGRRGRFLLVLVIERPEQRATIADWTQRVSDASGDITFRVLSHEELENADRETVRDWLTESSPQVASASA